MSHSSDPTTELKAHWNLAKPKVLVFDVNETLIDFESMGGLFERIFGERKVLREWYGRVRRGEAVPLLCRQNAPLPPLAAENLGGGGWPKGQWR